MYIDLLQIQRSSFLKFLHSGIYQVFDNINPIIIANRKYIFFSKYYLLKIPSKIHFASIHNQLDQISSFESYPISSFTAKDPLILPLKSKILKKHKRQIVPNLKLNTKQILKNSFFSSSAYFTSLYFSNFTHNKIINKTIKWNTTNKTVKSTLNKVMAYYANFNRYRPTPLYRPPPYEKMRAFININVNTSQASPVVPLKAKKYNSTQLTYCSEFYIPVQIIDNISKKVYLRWLLLADLPIQTKRGHFIINGYPKTVIHQIVRSPGIRFKNEENHILADIISMRGAWMGIQIVYEKNLKSSRFTNNSNSDFSIKQPNIAHGVVSQFLKQCVNNFDYKSKILPKEKSHFMKTVFSFYGFCKNENYDEAFHRFAQWNKIQKIRFYNYAKKSKHVNYHKNGNDHVLLHKENKYILLINNFFKIMVHAKTNKILPYAPSPFYLTFFNNSRAFKQWVYKNSLFLYFPIIKQKKKNLMVTILQKNFKFRNFPFVTINSALDYRKYINKKSNNFFTDPKTMTYNEKKNNKAVAYGYDKFLKMPYNSIKESQKINQALVVNFYLSPVQNEKKDKKMKLQSLPCFTFLEFLLHHRYFTYNNYVPSSIRSSLFPTLLDTSKSAYKKKFSVPFYTKHSDEMETSLNKNFYISFKNDETQQKYNRMATVLPQATDLVKININDYVPRPRLSFFSKKTLTVVEKDSYPAYFNRHNLINDRILLLYKHKQNFTATILNNYFNKSPRPLPYYLFSNFACYFPHQKFLKKNFAKKLHVPFNISYYLSLNEHESKLYFKRIMSLFKIAQSNKYRHKKKTPLNYNFIFSRPCLYNKNKFFLKYNANMYNAWIPTILKKFKNSRLFNFNNGPQHNIHTPLVVKQGFFEKYNSNVFKMQKPPGHRLYPGYRLISNNHSKTMQNCALKMHLQNSVYNTLSYFDEKKKHCQFWTSSSTRKLNTNRLLSSLVSRLNTTFFHDFLFERFMNPKFYDIGYMGRKRLNKKLRLNIPLVCTTLTPLDFLAIFYKLFNYYNNFHLIVSYFPSHQFALGQILNSSSIWPFLTMSHNAGSVALRSTEETLYGDNLISSPYVTNFFKPQTFANNIKQTGSLDHLNARHIRTCGEFLFLQFWRAILRYYQVLSQLSARSNFIKAPSTATGKTVRNFFLYDSISLNLCNNIKYNNIYNFRTIVKSQALLKKKNSYRYSLDPDFEQSECQTIIFNNNKTRKWYPHIPKFCLSCYYNIGTIAKTLPVFRFHRMSSHSLNVQTMFSWKSKISKKFQRKYCHNIYSPWPLTCKTGFLLFFNSKAWPAWFYIINKKAVAWSYFYDDKTALYDHSIIRSRYNYDIINLLFNNNYNSLYQIPSGFSTQTKRTSGTKISKTWNYTNLSAFQQLNWNNRFKLWTYRPSLNQNFATLSSLSLKANKPAFLYTLFSSLNISLNKLTNVPVTNYYPLYVENISNIQISNNDFNSIVPYSPYLKIKRPTPLTISYLKKFKKAPSENSYNYKKQHVVVIRRPRFTTVDKTHSLEKTSAYNLDLFLYFNFQKNSSCKLSIGEAMMYNCKTKTWPGNKEFYYNAKVAKAWGKTQIVQHRTILTFIKKLFYENKELRVFDAKERMRNLETKLFNGVLKEFFNSDPLSQDLDETNGLSEIIHKRRISALGKGGVTSKNAPLSIRSIHPSFYGRLCPIDSPEGDRVGLINSLTNYARITSIGYIATPFYRTRVIQVESALPTPLAIPNETMMKQFKHFQTKNIHANEMGKQWPRDYNYNSSYSFSYVNHLTIPTAQMRICPPLAFFGKMYKFYNNSSSLRPSFKQRFKLFLGPKHEKIKNRTTQWQLKNNLYGNNVITNSNIKIAEGRNSCFFGFHSTALQNCSATLAAKQLHNIKYNINKFQFSCLLPLKYSNQYYSYKQMVFHERTPKLNKTLVYHKNLHATGHRLIKNFTIYLSSPFAMKWNIRKNKQKSLQATALNCVNNINFYDSQYMTPPITYNECYVFLRKTQSSSFVRLNRLTHNNNIKRKQENDNYTPFLTGYFDFISFQGYAPLTAFQFFSPGVGLIPFLEHDDGTRALMGANMQRQAIPLISPSRPIVGTRLEKNIAACFVITSANSGYNYYISGKQSKQIFLNNVNFSSRPPPYYRFIKRPCYNSLTTSHCLVKRGVIKKKKKKYIFSKLNIKTYNRLSSLLRTLTNEKQICKIKPFVNMIFNPIKYDNIYNSVLPKIEKTKLNNLSFYIKRTHWLPYRKSYKATTITKKPAIFENSWVQKGDLLVDGTSSIKGELSLGRNLFSIYMPWEGYNFEDAILISDRAAQNYTTIHIEEFSVKISKNELLSSIIQPFTWVNNGDILVSKKRKLENEFIMNRLLFGMSAKSKNYSSDSSLLYKNNEQDQIMNQENQQFIKNFADRFIPKQSLKWNSTYLNSIMTGPYKNHSESDIIAYVSKKDSFIIDNGCRFINNNIKKMQGSGLGQLFINKANNNPFFIILPKNFNNNLFFIYNSTYYFYNNQFMQYAKIHYKHNNKIKVKKMKFFVLLTKIKIYNSCSSLCLDINDKQSLKTLFSFSNSRVRLYYKENYGGLLNHLSRWKNSRNLQYLERKQNIMNEMIMYACRQNLKSLNNNYPENIKKNINNDDNFEIDTSYRTSESICGWVICVKSNNHIVSKSLKEKNYNFESQSMASNEMKQPNDLSKLWKNTLVSDYQTKHYYSIYNLIIKKQLTPYFKRRHRLISPWSNVLKHLINLPKIVSISDYLKNLAEGRHSQNSFYCLISSKAWVNHNRYNLMHTKKWNKSISFVKHDYNNKMFDIIKRPPATALNKNPYSCKTWPWGLTKYENSLRRRYRFSLRYTLLKKLIIIKEPKGVAGEQQKKLKYHKLPPYDKIKPIYIQTYKWNLHNVNMYNETQMIKWELLYNYKYNNKLNISHDVYHRFSQYNKNFDYRFAITEPYEETQTSHRNVSDNLTIYLAVAKPLQVGDKMSGRHGNKGIISKILHYYDMPYLIDGTPIDIVLNPLGVPSRMNVGQIYESLLGYSGFYKHEYYRLPPFDENYSVQFSRNFVYWKLHELNSLHYFGPSIQDTINVQKLSSVPTFFNFFNNVKYHYFFNNKIKHKNNGYYSFKKLRLDTMKILFNGKNSTYRWFFLKRFNLQSALNKNKTKNSAYVKKNNEQSSIRPFLKFFCNAEKIGYNPYFPGKMRLLSGVNGEPFYRPVIVGKSYMLKLIHLVHHKIHARATGPYALITQQPLKGKRNQGGQRMGEMEIWALYGFGSASILYEMLTIKSDDPVGRERILKEIAGYKSKITKENENINNEFFPFSYNIPPVASLQAKRWNGIQQNEIYKYNINKNNDPFEKTIAESFRVLVMNLRALCLDMQVFKDLSNYS